MSGSQIVWSTWNLQVIPEVTPWDFKDAKTVKATRTWKGAKETRWYIVSSSQIVRWNVDETLVFPCMIDSNNRAVPTNMIEVAGTYPHSFMNGCAKLLNYLETV